MIVSKPGMKVFFLASCISIFLLAGALNLYHPPEMFEFLLFPGSWLNVFYFLWKHSQMGVFCSILMFLFLIANATIILYPYKKPIGNAIFTGAGFFVWFLVGLAFTTTAVSV